jgi:ABC-type uncharacterized transport system substrate-binding protein
MRRAWPIRAATSRELEVKRVALLHEAMPQAKRMAALFQTGRERQAVERKMRDASAIAGTELLPFEAEGPADYRAAFSAMRKAEAQSLLITASPTFNRDAWLLASLALEARLPVMCEWAENARSGCTFAYGPDRSAARRRLAHLVASIFKGAAPGELPIETPTHFELVVNLRSAKRVGIEVPVSLLVQADELIE